MAILDGTAAKSIEFVDEIAFGTFPTNPTMLGFGGYANPVSIKKTMVPETFAYLKGAGGTNRLQATETVKVSEAFEVSLEVRPVNWTMLPRILKASGPTVYAIGDTNYDVAFGVRIGSEYESLVGGVFSKYECTIEEDKTVVSNITALCAATNGFGLTYLGTGSHAADPAGDALTYGDMSSVLYDAAAISTHEAVLDSVKFGIEYPVKPVKDITSTLASNVGGWSFGQRNITLELGLSLEAMDLAADMLAGAGHTFAYTLGGKTFTFSNVKWIGDFDQKLDADDCLGMELKAEYVDLVIS